MLNAVTPRDFTVSEVNPRPGVITEVPERGSVQQVSLPGELSLTVSAVIAVLLLVLPLAL